MIPWVEKAIDDFACKLRISKFGPRFAGSRCRCTVGTDEGYSCGREGYPATQKITAADCLEVYLRLTMEIEYKIDVEGRQKSLISHGAGKSVT